MSALFVAEKSPKVVKVEILATWLNQAMSTNFACSLALTFSSMLVAVSLNLKGTGHLHTRSQHQQNSFFREALK